MTETPVVAYFSLAAQQGPLQVVFAGKAHPRDAAGKR
jgi:glucan phosphorylase